MLNKSRISGIKIWTPEWQQARLGKMTCSRISAIMKKGGVGDGFMSYIYEKVGEEITGNPIFDNDTATNAMRWGIENEPEAIQRFGKMMKLDFVVVQQLIIIPDSHFMGTPDALIVKNESVDQTCYNVATLEVKCPPTYKHYIPLSFCKTPKDVKEENIEYYWQVLDQMEICDCLEGYFVVYHPAFRAGNINVVHFKKVELIDDFRFLRERKQLATQVFEEVRSKVLAGTTM